MENIVEILGEKFEYDFLSGWIKYNRIQNGISQEALAHGICSTSHLSYFENGKKKLRGDIIEALLKKLNLHNSMEATDIGLLRQKFHNLMFQIEGFDYEAAKVIYNQLLDIENLISTSPYNIEYKIYQLMYKILVERKSYDDLCQDIIAIDKIYTSLNEELKYMYMLITGKLIYDFKNHGEGIERLETSFKLKETQWINYRLGVAYYHNLEPLKGILHLEKALDIYMKIGRYRNALECHSFLGMSYTELKIYDKAEHHFKAVLTGSDYFSMDKNIFGVYTNLSHLYFCMKDYDESMKWSKLAMEMNNDQKLCNDKSLKWYKSAWHINESPMIGAYLYVEACIKLNKLDDCENIFNKYLNKENEESTYYYFLYCLYLSIYDFTEEKFYKEITEKILPYYKNIGYLNIYKKVQLLLIEYLEKNRKYKEATHIYKESLPYFY